MLNTNFLIYALLDPITGHIRYVGLTTRGEKRPMSHCSKNHRRDKTRRACWTESLIAKGLFPTWKVLEYCTDEKDLSSAEKFWIAYCRYNGCPLVNHTDGGFNGRPDKETRKRLRDSHIQTHCKRGHEFTVENTYPNSKPDTKLCRTCACNRKRDRSRRVNQGEHQITHRCTNCKQVGHNSRTCQVRHTTELS